MRTIITTLIVASMLFGSKLHAQTNILATSTQAAQVMMGNYDPAAYVPSVIINDQHEVVCDMRSRISTDTLQSWLEKLATFHNRNTYSDTLSSTTGAGAARRWIYSKFQEFSGLNENRLIPSYLQFDWAGGLCGSGQFRNILAVLPGADTTDRSIVLVEGHMDSRCEDACDTLCQAHGMEDNGSGTVLVMELARVMSKYSFDHTLVFMVTVGEEQGLYGAHAFSQYAVDNGIAIKAVQNNDIVGGVVCGKTSSPPSCPAENEIDSLEVRIFSNGSFTSGHRNYARFIKLTYEEKYLPMADIPMTISIMNQEDRTGRGGDHQPFRQRGFTAIRFTSAHEHGHGGPGPGYTDRQHSVTDILGVDTTTPPDGIIDSFFVDFNYLKRNTVINALSMSMASMGPEIPVFQLIDDPTGLMVDITGPAAGAASYRVGVRDGSNPDFDAVYGFSDTTLFLIPGLQAATTYFISLAAVDSNGIMGMFTGEQFAASDANTDTAAAETLGNTINCGLTFISEEILTAKRSRKKKYQYTPNPFSDQTTISIQVTNLPAYNQAFMVITDLLGREVKRIKIDLVYGMNYVQYLHPERSSGAFHYSLVLDDEAVQSKSMIVNRK